jgi:hypothetical protein
MDGWVSFHGHFSKKGTQKHRKKAPKAVFGRFFDMTKLQQAQ